MNIVNLGLERADKCEKSSAWAPIEMLRHFVEMIETEGCDVRGMIVITITGSGNYGWRIAGEVGTLETIGALQCTLHDQVQS